MPDMNLPFEDPNQDFDSDASGESKKRKLDELFADEPYLSPTMKARLLHEKLQQAEQRDQVEAQNLSEALVNPIVNRDAPVVPTPIDLTAESALPPALTPPLPLNGAVPTPLNVDAPADRPAGGPLNGAVPPSKRPPIRLEEMLRLPEAAGYLRGGGEVKADSEEGRIDPASFARLMQFRAQVLEGWLKNLPENQR